MIFFFCVNNLLLNRAATARSADRAINCLNRLMPDAKRTQLMISPAHFVEGTGSITRAGSKKERATRELTTH